MKLLDLSTTQRVKVAKHWFQEINQLYHPTGEFGQDSQDFVYSYENFNSSKFTTILLKEWFYLLKKDGYLVIDYIPNTQCDFKKLENDMWWLWKNKYDILFHGPVGSSELNTLTTNRISEFSKNPPSQQLMPKETSGFMRFVCRKIESTIIPGDEINKWTFGMITKGERNDWIEEIIEAIHKQNIPNFEIIVCGTYHDRKEKNFTYIPFNQRDDKGWITKKKNLMARVAKYENFCFIHDRLVLDKNWFTGMKKYGNCFELLCNKQNLRGTKIRSGDWLTYGSNILNMPFSIANLEYTDWDDNVYMGGHLSIWKKSIWQICPWNETLYWGEEDVELTFRARNNGYITRFNPFSYVEALAWRFGALPTKYYPSQGFLPKDMLLRRIMRKINYVVFSVPAIKELLFPIIMQFTKTKLYNFLTQH